LQGLMVLAWDLLCTIKLLGSKFFYFYLHYKY
jgi:hypothetical protein